jgi:hypothetical protein
MEAGRWPANQIHNSLFEDLLIDPLRVVEALYGRFGISLGDATRREQPCTTRSIASRELSTPARTH